jgi:hypothetical protein
MGGEEMSGLKLCKEHQQEPNQSHFAPDNCDYCKLQKSATKLAKALALWEEFWDDMPKGQLGRIVCNIGLLNEAFCSTSQALAAWKEAQEK